ncbi:MAG TPA: zinc-binding dehydrogenase, partial [Acetobacteraceae bacterium]|nr:zinc-binding dehydrogenase [Acetobacteraceae bacterium]
RQEAAMHGVVFTGERDIELMEFPDPTPGPGEVVLEMKASGMCGSDLKPYRRPKGGDLGGLGLTAAAGPVIGGHEPCGVVAAVGAGVAPAEARRGMRVMVHHYWGCNVCEHCRSGWTQLCARQAPAVYGMSDHGGHAPYMKVPARTLVALPETLSFQTGAAIACGTGTAYGALRRMNLSGRDVIAIFGQGPVGLSATQLAAAMGARVIALDINPERLARAAEFGADALVDPGAGDPVAAIRDLTGGGAHLALDTTGHAEGRIAAVRCVRTWGTVCFVGEGGDVTIEVSPDMLRRQVTIVASWTFSTIGQAECAEFVAARGVDVDRLFTHRWELGQADEAYRLFDRQSDGKGVFLM